MNKEYILYLGNYLDEKIVSERKLPTNNIAGTNRMQRISSALSYYFRPVIISPGISMRIKKNEKIALNSRIHRTSDFIVYYTSSIGIPYLSIIISYFTYYISVFKILHKIKAKNVIVYNFDPLLFYIVLTIRVFYPKINIVNNIEDISIPKLSDFNKHSEDRGLQQYIFFFCMKAIAYMVHSYIIPSKRFINYLPSKNRIMTITGCIAVKEKYFHLEKEQINILFAGKIAFEHGIDVFTKSLKLLDKTVYAKKLKIDITGTGNKKEWLENELKNLNNISIHYHGFVSNSVFQKILNHSDVCIALQKDAGRHAEFKTPSKVYEYLGNAKIVIATDVGDLSKISPNFIKICKPVTPYELKLRLIDILENKSRISDIKKKVHSFAKSEYDTKKIGKVLYQFLNS